MLLQKNKNQRSWELNWDRHRQSPGLTKSNTRFLKSLQNAMELMVKRWEFNGKKNREGSWTLNYADVPFSVVKLQSNFKLGLIYQFYSKAEHLSYAFELDWYFNVQHELNQHKQSLIAEFVKRGYCTKIHL